MADTSPLTVGEFDRSMAAMRDEIRIGFARINGRLNRHGEALTDHGQQLARHDERLDVIETRPVATAAVVTAASPSKDGVETISLSLSPRMWTLLAGLFGLLQFLGPIIAKRLGLL